jgi:hypothetical protein
MGGTDESGKLLPPERPNWAGAMCKSQNALEIVLGVWNSGFGIWHINKHIKCITGITVGWDVGCGCGISGLAVLAD